MRKSTLRYAALVPVALVLTMIFQNCGQPGSITAIPQALESPTGDIPTDIPPEVIAQYGIEILPSEKFICEPFGNMNGGDIKGGLKAELAYVNPQLNLDAGTKNAFGSAEYFDGASSFIKTTTPLFLSQINVPNQNFDKGFKLSDGSTLGDSNGNKLIEWFALKMKSVLKLSDDDEAGMYEFATISDDGSRLFFGDKEIVSNDGAHSARMKCSAEAIQIGKTSRIPLTYYYNQGPRTEIASVLIWRLKSSTSALGHRLCGVSSRTQFWKPEDSSEAEYWSELKRDGWRIVDVKNFELPNSQTNPCATQNSNLISKALFSPLVNGTSTLNLDFVMKANVKAKLFKIVNGTPNLAQFYDFSAQALEKVSVMLPSLENGATYSIEVVLEMPASGTQVLNEVRFRVKLL